VRQGETRRAADVAGVRRVVATVEFGAAAVPVIILLGDASCALAETAAQLARRNRAGIVDFVKPVAAFAVLHHLLEIEHVERAEEVVAVLVVVTGHGDEVAVRADLLIETAVVLLLANFAVVVERIVVAGPRRRNEGARAEAGDVAGVDHAERTNVGAVAGAFGENVAVARRRDDAERFAGN